jgi:hypothetical protein
MKLLNPPVSPDFQTISSASFEEMNHPSPTFVPLALVGRRVSSRRASGALSGVRSREALHRRVAVQIRSGLRGF